MNPPDVIDHLAGITPGSRLAEVRAQRPQARANAQASYDALFRPAEPGGMSIAERHAVAAFVARLHGDAEIAGFYEGATGGVDVAAEAGRGAAHGPYGRYPAGPLSTEDAPGPLYRVSAEHRAALGARLAAAFEHAHMLVFHPRDASPAALQALLDAGWSTQGIVTLSQLVSFLAFQIRVVAGLRSLGGH